MHALLLEWEFPGFRYWNGELPCLLDISGYFHFRVWSEFEQTFLMPNPELLPGCYIKGEWRPNKTLGHKPVSRNVFVISGLYWGQCPREPGAFLPSDQDRMSCQGWEAGFLVSRSLALSFQTFFYFSILILKTGRCLLKTDIQSRKALQWRKHSSETLYMVCQ